MQQSLPERVLAWTAEITGQHVEPSTPWNNDLAPELVRWDVLLRAEDRLGITLTDDDMESFTCVGDFVDRVAALACEGVE